MDALECRFAGLQDTDARGEAAAAAAAAASAAASASVGSVEERRIRSRFRRRMLFANVQTFAHRTSAHGLGRFFSQQIPWLRSLWCVVVVGALTGLTLHTYKQVSLFRDYPVSSTTRLLTNRFAFPDVTFCDPLMKKFLTKESSQLRQLVEINNYFALSLMLGFNFSSRRSSLDEARVRATKIAYSSFEHAVHTWPEFNMTDVSARILDMLVYCQYNQEPCSEQNFTVFYHRDYGNCFSFKANNRTIKSSGVEKGLVLVLYSPSVDIIQNNDYYSNIVTTGLETGGLRVVVHQKDTIPYPSEYGINSPSGMQTVLALSQVQTSLANTPTKRCKPRSTLHAYDHLLDKTQSYERQLADCTTFEHWKNVQNECRCYIEGLLKTSAGSKPKVDFCHDLLGAQRPQQLLPLLKDFVQFIKTDKQLSKYQLLTPDDRISARRFRQLSLNEKFWISTQLASRFQSVSKRLSNLRCALPYLQSGRQQSTCRNICKYTTYDFSVFQSRWPDLSFQIRGARIRLARIAQMLQNRINAIDASMRAKRLTGKDANHALNHSIAVHKIDLSRCLESQLNQMTKSFADDKHCEKVHNIVRQSFLQLRVYPKTLTVRQLFEERSYELVNLFSDLGGIMGLWIGVSMVTLCDFVEIVLIVSSYYLRSVVRKLWRLTDGDEPPQAGGKHSLNNCNSNHVPALNSASCRRHKNHCDPCAYQQPRLQQQKQQPQQPQQQQQHQQLLRGGCYADASSSPWTDVQLPLLPSPAAAVAAAPASAPAAAAAASVAASADGIEDLCAIENRFSFTAPIAAAAAAPAATSSSRRRTRRADANISHSPSPASPAAAAAAAAAAGSASVLCNKETQL